MPEPGIIQQIDQFIEDHAKPQEAEQMRSYLYDLANRAESGDKVALATLQTYGIAANRPQGGIIPDTIASFQRGIASIFGKGTAPPSTDTGLTAEQKRSLGPTGPREYEDPHGRIWQAKWNPTGGVNGEGDWDYTNPYSPPEHITWSQPEYVTDPNGKLLLTQTNSRGEVVIRDETAPKTTPSTAITQYQAGQLGISAGNLAVNQGQLAVSQQRLGFDVAKWEAANQPPPPPEFGNPENPNESSQRQEWMAARAANGEDPYDFSAFQQHMAAIGAPEPSWEGFQRGGSTYQGVQGRDQQIQDAQDQHNRQLAIIDQNYQNQVRLMGVDSETARLNREESRREADQQYQVALGNLGVNQGQLALNQQLAEIQAAQTGQPLAYLSLTRGGIPGQGGEIYRGLRTVVPTLAGQNNYAPTTGQGGTGSNLTPDMVARVRSGLRGAGWPQADTASPQDAVAKYLSIAQPDDFSRQLQAAMRGSTEIARGSLPGRVQNQGYTPEQIARVRAGLRSAGWPNADNSSDADAVNQYLAMAQPDAFTQELRSISNPPLSTGTSSSTSGITADMMARVRGGLASAGWGGGTDQEAIDAYLKTAQPDAFSNQLRLANQSTEIGRGSLPGRSATSSGVTPEQMARIRTGLQQAGWPGGSDEEAVSAYLRTAVPDEFKNTVYSASGQWNPPPMPSAMATIASGSALSAPSLPVGAMTIPGVQGQANELPSERSARLEAMRFQGIPTADVEDMEKRTRLSLGPGVGTPTWRSR